MSFYLSLNLNNNFIQNNQNHDLMTFVNEHAATIIILGKSEESICDDKLNN